MISNEEKELLSQVNIIAEKIGYGHVIAYLKMKWLDISENKWGLPRDNKIAEVEPYPKGFFERN